MTDNTTTPAPSKPVAGPVQRTVGRLVDERRNEGMNYRKAGFTQRKPREPGVYLISASPAMPRTAPPRLRDGWDVAEVMYWAGSYDNAYRNSERGAFWQITTLGGGVTFAWQPGMWIKGPISPDNVAPNA